MPSCGPRTRAIRTASSRAISTSARSRRWTPGSATCAWPSTRRRTRLRRGRCGRSGRPLAMRLPSEAIVCRPTKWPAATYCASRSSGAAWCPFQKRTRSSCTWWMRAATSWASRTASQAEAASRRQAGGRARSSWTTTGCSFRREAPRERTRYVSASIARQMGAACRSLAAGTRLTCPSLR